MKTDPATGAPVPALTGADLAAAVPRLADLARIEVVEFANLPSAYMGPDLWPSLSRTVADLLARPEVAGAVVLHGTDTLDQTAYFLDLTLASDKPVVMVGAQRNASDADADGARNLLNAVRQILAQGARGDLQGMGVQGLGVQGLGVTVTLNHNINAAREVRKTHTTTSRPSSPARPASSATWTRTGWCFPASPCAARPCRCPSASHGWISWR